MFGQAHFRTRRGGFNSYFHFEAPISCYHRLTNMSCSILDQKSCGWSVGSLCLDQAVLVQGGSFPGAWVFRERVSNTHQSQAMQVQSHAHSI